MLKCQRVFKAVVPAAMLFLCVESSGATEISFSGSSLPVISVAPDKSSGLDKVYVASEINGLRLSMPVSGTDIPVWYRYSNLGGGFAEEVASTVEDGSSVLNAAEGDMGYIVETGDTRYCFWLVDYSAHRFSITSVVPAAVQDCDASLLEVAGDGSPIHFYSISGRQMVLDRDIKVNYSTLEWNEEGKTFEYSDQEKNFQSLSSTVSLTPPAYCATTFRVSGDRFLREWGMEETAESPVMQPVAVDCRTEAVQEEDGLNEEEESNVIRGDSSSLGGSAPAVIEFFSHVTDGVVHFEWQIADDEDFQYVTHRLTERNLSFTFTEEGTQYVRFIGSDADGSCETYGDVYTVSIGASELKCPNAFSPDGDGVNDRWKVAYRSLLSFKCWIFDRYGTQLYYFDDPDGGWDGRYKGKTVKSGVYYYVIQAIGADGRKYRKSGDINIIRHRTTGNSASPEE